MNLWRKPCEHGRYEAHTRWQRGVVQAILIADCPGGSPVTEADILEAAKKINDKWHQEPT